MNKQDYWITNDIIRKVDDVDVTIMKNILNKYGITIKPFTYEHKLRIKLLQGMAIFLALLIIVILISF